MMPFSPFLPENRRKAMLAPPDPLMAPGGEPSPIGIWCKKEFPSILYNYTFYILSHEGEGVVMKHTIFFLSIVILGTCLFLPGAARTVENRDEMELKAFLDSYVAKIQPLMKKREAAYWEATGTGKKEAYALYAGYEVDYKKIHADKENFALLKKFRESGKIQDPILARELLLVYNKYAQNQCDPALLEKIVNLSTRIENLFNTSRGTYQGKTVSDNDLLAVLAREKNSALRREAWQAQKSVGSKVAPLLIQLVKLRNQAAREMGFPDFYEMQMTLDEQDVREIFGIFDKLAAETDVPFRAMKKAIDEELSARWNITPGEMRPWHYQDFFFQEAPELEGVDLDSVFAGRDVKKLVAGFYDGINLNVDRILKKSDLYEREGKYQHAYCMDLDREGDVRIMCNVRNNAYWTGTLLHELGHSVYSFYHDRTMPFLLRDAAHTFTTEAVAQLMERCAGDPEWLVKVAGASPAEMEKAGPMLKRIDRMGRMVFCRWSQVMVHFERELYRDPDQNLNRLWWDMVEKYQLIRRPEKRNSPDWAAKIHFTSSPVYYHNYLLGQLLASQLVHRMKTAVLWEKEDAELSFVDRPELGAFLISRMFYPGARYRWNELVNLATGEELTPVYYVRELSE
jgi:peptidyl-dipeptidase A